MFLFSPQANGTGEWKVMFGICFTGLAISLWLWMFCKTYVYNPIPNTFTEDFKQNNLRMAIATRKDPVTVGSRIKWIIYMLN
jgi:dipeptide/tripeptide permease